MSTAKLTSKKPISALAVFAEIILSVLLFAVLLASLAVFEIRNAFTEKNIEKIIDSLSVGELLGESESESSGTTADICDFINESYSADVSEKELESFIEKSTVNTYLAEKLSDFTDNLLEEDAALTFTSSEISELLHENTDLFESELGFTLSASDIDTIAEEIIPDGTITVYSSAELMEEVPEVLSVLGYCSSIATAALLVIVTVLIILLMVSLGATKALCAVGVDLVLTAVIASALSALSSNSHVWAEALGAPELSMLMGNTAFVNGVLAATLFSLGIAAFVTRALVIKARRKKFA